MAKVGVMKFLNLLRPQYINIASARLCMQLTEVLKYYRADCK